MKLPGVKNAQKYVGLYVVDFGDSCSLGFTAQEVAELLESEKFADAKVYQICRAQPDGTMELKGVLRETFELEMGMFFYSEDEDQARANFEALVDLAKASGPPCRAKVHLARYDDHKYAMGIIYPAEYNDQVSSWLNDGGVMLAGFAEGGIETVQRYYADSPEILESEQLFGESSYAGMTGVQLLSAVKTAVVR